MSTLSSPSLQSLISEVRTMLNQPDPQNSFWKDEEITNHLNEGVRLYFAEVSQLDEGYFTTSTTLDITSGSDTVALPSDCFRVKGLYKQVTQGEVLLAYRNNVTEGYSTSGGTSSQSYLPYYYFQSNNLVLRPTPQFSETASLRIEYIQFPTQMLYGGDTMTAQVSPVFKQLIVMYAVYKCKLKESLVNGVIVHKVAEENVASLYKSFQDAIQQRSKNPTYIIPYNPEFGGI